MESVLPKTRVDQSVLVCINRRRRRRRRRKQRRQDGWRVSPFIKSEVGLLEVLWKCISEEKVLQERDVLCIGELIIPTTESWKQKQRMFLLLPLNSRHRGNSG